MKKFIAACIIGLGCLGTTAAPVLAESYTVTVSDHGYRPHSRHHERDRWERRHHRPHYRTVCRTKTVKYRHHGRWVSKTTRVCR
ncbi:hypothetical protein [Neorhizobium alkalisoli]|jgi:hypothetical protein|uniref:Uncharacterized protein n=1 Tax=Neorhizobium alkalisoli TaxID=528178 RepID=A0A561R1C2_9HYPH|nr:hypothetical protein [Neorhizobium alkalisoli]TWF56405.1 hypothetical protein FHW37_10231 [Neorhizobium alkalisoli]